MDFGRSDQIFEEEKTEIFEPPSDSHKTEDDLGQIPQRTRTKIVTGDSDDSIGLIPGQDDKNKKRELSASQKWMRDLRPELKHIRRKELEGKKRRNSINGTSLQENADNKLEKTSDKKRSKSPEITENLAI